MTFVLLRVSARTKTVSVKRAKNRLPLPPEFSMCTRSTIATVVVRPGFPVLSLLRYAHTRVLCCCLLHFHFRQGAPGLVAVAALSKRIKGISTRTRPWRGLGSIVQCVWIITYKAKMKFQQTYILYIKFCTIVHATTSDIYVFAQDSSPLNLNSTFFLDSKNFVRHSRHVWISGFRICQGSQLGQTQAFDKNDIEVNNF